MANKIIRGTTAAASFIGQRDYPGQDYAPECDTTTLLPGEWYITEGGNLQYEGVAIAYSGAPGNWAATDGTVSAPSDAALGSRSLYYTIDECREVVDEIDGEYYTNYYRVQSVYQFEVVCMTTEVTVNSTLNEELPGGMYKHAYTAHAANEGGTSPFTYSWSVPGTVTAGAGTSDIDFYIIDDSIANDSSWGTANVTVTDADGCTSTASSNVAATGGGSGSGTDANDPAGPGNGCSPCLGCC